MAGAHVAQEYDVIMGREILPEHESGHDKDQAMDPDPHLHPVRANAAAERYRGQIRRERYLTPWRGRIMVDSTMIYSAPGYDQTPDTEALFGEDVDIFDEENGWVWLQMLSDGYVGYAPRTAVRAADTLTTHHVCSLRTHVHASPDIKSRPLHLISINSRVAVEDIHGCFARLSNGEGYVFADDLKPLDHFQDDFVSVAERFLNTPYHWGGRTSLGIDCSALVQMSLFSAGHFVLRDSYMQEASIGVRLEEPLDHASLRRGDLVFWQGHVGILVDAVTLLHANAHFMRVVKEPLSDVIARIQAVEGRSVSSVRRLVVQ